MTDKQPEALSIAKRLKNQQQPLSLALREKAAAELRRLHEENEKLWKIINSRPAINAGLPQTYIDWSRSIYAMDFFGNQGWEQ